MLASLLGVRAIGVGLVPDLIRPALAGDEPAAADAEGGLDAVLLRHVVEDVAQVLERLASLGALL